ncbi:MAG: hypothetical protein LBO09_01120 [Candidatus Peribacteria bacterium]|jgi:hypothetical protein|nr:hypothetical protein [Candidatus Peribacteria bacterium]
MLTPKDAFSSEKKANTLPPLTPSFPQLLQILQAVEEIGDLKYDDLASFFQQLSSIFTSDMMQNHLHQASLAIQQAWTISKPYMIDPTTGDLKPTKHLSHLPSLNLSREETVQLMKKGNPVFLSQFFSSLSAKIKKDAEADQARGRKQLCTALFACAEHLAHIANSLS